MEKQTCQPNLPLVVYPTTSWMDSRLGINRLRFPIHILAFVASVNDDNVSIGFVISRPQWYL